MGVRNPVVRRLVRDIPSSSVRAAPDVIASLWWRTMVLAALEVDLHARPADLAHALVHGLRTEPSAPVGDGTGERASLHA